MITLFHGSDTTKSRNAFLSAKAEFADTSITDGARVTLAEVRQEGSGGLFDTEKKPLFIDELLSKKKVSKELEAICAYILSEKDLNVYIWESKELTAKQSEVLGKVIVKKFDLPKQLFAFLDSVRPGNTAELLRLFHEVISTEAPELVLTMLTRQIRILLALSTPAPMPYALRPTPLIDEVARLAPWQSGKLQKQANSFSIEKLLYVHHKLFQIDLEQKTGKNMMPLSDTIDFLLMGI